MTDSAEQQIARLNILARLDLLPGATSLVRQIASGLGLDEDDARRLELVAEEACVNVIEHAFEPGEPGSYEISVLRRPGQVVVAVEDQGLPFDFRRFESGGESGLGTVLMKAFADEVRYLNLGRRGKRVELVKNIPERNSGAVLKQPAGEAAAAPEGGMTFRLMRPEESVNLARCAYRCYSYTYPNELLYFPDRVRELVASRLVTSFVAVAPDGEIAGHVATVRENAGDLVGESGQAVTDPRYRGHGLYNRLGQLLREHNRRTGLLGTYGEAVTVHCHTQKGAISRGATVTGILLGYIPSTMFFRAIQSETMEKRRPVVVLYTRLNEEPVREVYLPPQHQGILRRIYEKSGLRRRFATGEIGTLPERSRLDVRVNADACWAFLRVNEYGRDLEELVRFRLRELCLRHLDCIYLDLPLSHPAAQRYCAAMELMGFFFGGLMPELYQGDCLRLQFMNNARLELDDVHIASDFSRELYAYVLKCGGMPPHTPLD